MEKLQKRLHAWYGLTNHAFKNQVQVKNYQIRGKTLCILHTGVKT